MLKKKASCLHNSATMLFLLQARIVVKQEIAMYMQLNKQKINPCLIYLNVSKLFVIIFQELVSDKEEGLHMLQISLDNLQIVLPNTSVAGRDSMRREMQVLQSEYDGLSADINDLKTKLDSTLTQWTVYDDSIEQLGRWLRDLEDQLEAESQLQNTLQEKKLQQERVKVC